MEHSRVTRRLFRPMTIAVLAALANTAGAGINDLVNSTFDEDLNGWTIFGLPDEAAWDGLDVADSADSGSALLSQENAGFVTMLGQCVPVTSDVLHSMSSWIFVPGGQNADGRAGIEIEWFSGPDCNNADRLETVVRELDPLVEGGWTSLARGATAPADAVAALALLRVKNNDGVFRWEAHFDDAPFGAGILPGMGFGLSATGEASVEPDGQGNFTVSGIGDTFDDGVDIGFGAGSVFEATDQPIITPGTLADAVTPSDLAGAITPSDFRLELADSLDAADFEDGAALLLAAHVLLTSDGDTQTARGSIAGAVTPSDIRRAGLAFSRATLPDSAWFASPGGVDLFPQGAHELVLKNNGQVVAQESQRTDPLPLSVVPRRQQLRLDRGRLKLRLQFDNEQLIGDSLRFDEAIFLSEVSREVRDFLPAVQLRAANLPAVQLGDANIRSDSVRIRGLGRAILNLQPDGRLAIENFGGSGADGLRIQPAGEPSTRARLEFDRSLPAGEVSGTVEGPQPCLLPGEPLARFQAADIGEVFETTAEFFGTGGGNSPKTLATALRQAETVVRGTGESDASTLRIFNAGALITEVEAFTGAVRTPRSLGNAYAAWVCDGGRLCNEFRWDQPTDIELDGAGTFTGDRLVWVLGDDDPLPPDIINGVEYFAADMPARSMTAASADDRVFADEFDG